MYSSDLTEEEWGIIWSIIGRCGEQGRPPPQDARHVWNGIFYVSKNGCFWRDLPKDFGPWKRVYNYFNRLKHRGIFDKITDELRNNVRLNEDREKNPTLAIIDSQSVKSRSFKK